MVVWQLLRMSNRSNRLLSSYFILDLDPQMRSARDEESRPLLHTSLQLCDPKLILRISTFQSSAFVGVHNLAPPFALPNFLI